MNAVRMAGGVVADGLGPGTRVEAAYVAPCDVSVREAQLLEQAMLYAAARQMQKLLHRRRTGDELR